MSPRRPFFPLHPFMFSVYPVIALLANNIEQVRAGEALRPLLISLGGTAVICLVFWLLLRDAPRAALAAALVVGLFFSYGHVYNALEPLSLLGFHPGRHRLLLPLWAVLLALGLLGVMRTRRDLTPATRALNLAAAVAVALPLAQIGLFAARSLRVAPVEASAGEFAHLRLPAGQPAPDIYYIILDGYTRDDQLQKFYDLDNRPFLEELEALGFTVARCSQSNYAQTQLSLASSLNADYLEALGEQFHTGNTSRVGLAGLIRDSRVRRALEGLGYRTVAFETGFEATQLEDAAVYLSAGSGPGVEDFENLLVRTTAGRVLAEGIAFLNLKPDWAARDEAHRQRILYTLRELPEVAGLPGPKFVFAHLVIPHWPHVFGPDGQPVHAHPDSVSGYRDQVVFINHQIAPVLAEILARSAAPPVIVLQGDHGAVIESPERRMPILNAYFLPGGGAAQLYAGISPVNTFRVILDQYFGETAPLLDDRALYSSYEHPYDFQPVPNERTGCGE